MPTALRRLLDQRSRPIPPRMRATLLLVTTVGVVVASVWAWQSADLDLADLDWLPLIALFAIAAPLSLGLKAAEFRVAAAIADQRPSLRRCLDVAVLSSAANLLPLPGSLLVTVHSLSEDGTNYGTAVNASAVPGLTWLSVTGMVGGAAIAIEGNVWLGLTAVAGGLLIAVVANTMFRRTAPAEGRVSLAFVIIAVEAGWLAVSALRLSLAVTALGVSIEPLQAVALSVAGAITVAIGFVPGGLGVREGLIAALAPIIGLDVETGVLLGSLDRVVWLAFLALAALVSVRAHRADA
ncbi:MAG: hypothetical protein P8J50_09385 [Acidimicrobiales bacterium]|jgi:hypothetical protein|nr:hypothetical protein [Acidimicrobiales bacterium]